MSGFAWDVHVAPHWLERKLLGEDAGPAPSYTRSMLDGLDDYGTDNQQHLALVVALVDGADGVPGLIARRLVWERDEVGHMLRDLLSASHAHVYLNSMVAAAIWANQHSRPRLLQLVLEWLAHEATLCRRLRLEVKRTNAKGKVVTKRSVVTPCFRAWGGWKPGDVPASEQHSPYRDAFAAIVLDDEHRLPAGVATRHPDGPIEPKKFDAGNVSLRLLRHPDFPMAELRAAVLALDPHSIRLFLPVYERTGAGDVLRWIPNVPKGFLGKPVCHWARVDREGRESYGFEPLEHEPVPTDVLGRPS